MALPGNPWRFQAIPNKLCTDIHTHVHVSMTDKARWQRMFFHKWDCWEESVCRNVQITTCVHTKLPWQTQCVAKLQLAKAGTLSFPITSKKCLDWMHRHPRQRQPDWWLPLWVGYGKFACAVTVISHNLTCIPPSVMLQSETEREQEAWWDGTLVNASCLRGNNLWRILSLLCLLCRACVRAHWRQETQSFKEYFHLFC